MAQQQATLHLLLVSPSTYVSRTFSFYSEDSEDADDFFVLSDQQMFTASQYEFRSFPDIRRNSPAPMLRTEDAPTRWLNGELKFYGACSSSQALGHPAKKQLWISFLFCNLISARAAVRTIASFPPPYRGGLCRLCSGEGEHRQQHR